MENELTLDDLMNDNLEGDKNDTTTEIDPTSEQDLQETNTNQEDDQPEENLQDLFEETQTKPKDQLSKTVKDNKTKQQPGVADNTGNLVDQSGNVIAKAGAERRFYEENQRLKSEQQKFNTQIFPAMKQQYDRMEAEVNAYKKIFDDKDISTSDLNSGIEFVKNWKKDPKETVKFLLTSLAASGISVDIEGMQPGIVNGAIKQIIDEKFKPFDQERAAREAELEKDRRIEQEYNTFVEKYPDSVVHDTTLARMIEANPRLTPVDAYYQLKNYYLQKGFDFTKPIEVIAEQNRNTQNTANVGLPKTPTVNSNIPVINKNQSTASTATSYNDIVNSVLADVGLKR